MTEERLLTIQEVAEALRVDSTTVRRWVKEGTLDAVTLPHKGKRYVYRVRQSELDAVLSPDRPAAG